ncbi:MAG: glycosyltransferase [Verrucomicrobia bacterium]|nr:glycosyltransferase [Verrucomicrobiota bacterium]
MNNLLYFAPASYGGLLNYTQEQADAIAALGVDVQVVCSPNFIKREFDRYSVLPILMESRAPAGGNKILRGIRYIRILLKNMAILKAEIIKGEYKKVLFAAYTEYFSPLWAIPFIKLAQKGVEFGAVVQEPVRDFRVGPVCWHKLSIATAYRFLKYAFVHESVTLDTGYCMSKLKTVVIPYGPHRFPSPSKPREVLRQQLGIPAEALVLLSFGHIRDNKNLDYAVRALVEIPDAFLLVAGKRSASSQRPESYYQDLAIKLGVADRCKWILEYVSEEDAANYFTASDLILLTYSSSFRSASGVLHVAARYEKPSIVSAGQGSLQSVVRKYGIGLWVEPDSPYAVVEGIKTWVNCPRKPDWESYRVDNSWILNAKIVLDSFKSAD